MYSEKTETSTSPFQIRRADARNGKMRTPFSTNPSALVSAKSTKYEGKSK